MKNSKTKKPTKEQIIDSINAQVIAGLQEKGLKWFKPFKDSTTGQFRAVSSSGRAYKGWNQFILSNTALANNWVNKWFTFDAVSKAGGQVTKGQKSTLIYYWTMLIMAEDSKGKVTFYKSMNNVPDNLKDKVKKVPILKPYWVFSVSQTNLPHNTIISDDKGEELGVTESAEKIVKAWSKIVPLKHSGEGSAYYNPSLDFIHMPNKKSNQWKCEGDYYKVYFHEAVHSTGHETRLNRLDKMASFGSDNYSKEELVAEIGALYLETITGIEAKIDDFKNSQAYINGWIKKFNSDPNLILWASGRSHEAIDLILNSSK